MQSPTEQVLETYQIPFMLRVDQCETIDEVCRWDRCGLYLPVGAGKTVVSTLVALYAGLHDMIDQIIVLCPPILLRQWANWMETFKPQGLECLLYKGTPAKRKELPLGKPDVIITTPGMFKNDFERFMGTFGDRKVYLIVDEATCVRQVGTLTHKAVRDFMETGQKMLSLLTGTTISAPYQAYGYIKLINPTIYRDYRHFTLCHITALDKYKTPCTYQHLDILEKNMKIQTVRREAADIMDLPEVNYVPVVYDLEPAHMRLYNKVVEEMLVTLPDGTILDGLTPQRMRMTAQRVILMPCEFGGEKIKPAGFELIDVMADELGRGKFIIYSNFQSSNEAVFDYCEAAGLNPVIVYGGDRSSASKNLASLARFKEDPSCQVMAGNPGSCGVGVDGLQDICHAVLFLELPTPANFLQAVGRIERQGQKTNCVVKIGVANRTIQVDMQRNSLKKEDLAQRVVPTKATLRRALMGG